MSPFSLTLGSDMQFIQEARVTCACRGINKVSTQPGGVSVVSLGAATSASGAGGLVSSAEGAA